VQATIYDAGRRCRNERERRAACLRAIVEDAARRGDTVLVLEQDDSLVSWDNQRLIEFTRAAGGRDTLRYEHRRAAADLALAIRTRSSGAGPKTATGDEASSRS